MIYLIKVQLVFTVLCLLYWLLLRRERALQLNRAVLIAAIVLPFVLPLVPMAVEIAASDPVFLSENGAEFMATSEVATTAAEPIAEVTADSGWLTLLLLTYQLVAALLLLKLFFTTGKLLRQLKTAEQTPLPFPHRRLAGFEVPFSFFGTIVVDDSRYSAEQLRRIHAHELIHVKQLHSLDVMLMEIVACLLWVNPLVHLHRKLLRNNLEYLADRGTVDKCTDVRAYQYDLLAIGGKNSSRLANHYASSNLKTRITMMNSDTTSRFTILKYLAVLPVLYFTYTTVAPRYFTDADVVVQEEEAVTITVNKPVKDNSLGLILPQKAEAIYIRIHPGMSAKELHAMSKFLKQFDCDFQVEGYNVLPILDVVGKYKFSVTWPNGSSGYTAGNKLDSKGAVFFYLKNGESGVSGNYNPNQFTGTLDTMARRFFRGALNGAAVVEPAGNVSVKGSLSTGEGC